MFVASLPVYADYIEDIGDDGFEILLHRPALDEFRLPFVVHILRDLGGRVERDQRRARRWCGG